MDLEVVNTVESGHLGMQIDLNQLTADIEEAKLNWDEYPRAK